MLACLEAMFFLNNSRNLHLFISYGGNRVTRETGCDRPGRSQSLTASFLPHTGQIFHVLVGSPHTAGGICCCSLRSLFVTEQSARGTLGWEVRHITHFSPVCAIFIPSRYQHMRLSSVQFSCSVVSDSATPWIAARQASLSITNSRSSLRLMCIELVMPSSHLILCRPLLLLPLIPPSIRVFSNESTLHIRWPKYWSFSLSISPSNEQINWLAAF